MQDLADHSNLLAVNASIEAANVIDASSKQQTVGVDQVADTMRSIEDALRQTLDYTSRLELAPSQLEEIRERFGRMTGPLRVW